MSLAIQYRMKKGGMLTDDGYQSTCDEHCNYPCDVHMGDAEGYAGGGDVKGVHKEAYPGTITQRSKSYRGQGTTLGQSEMGFHARLGKTGPYPSSYRDAKDHARKNLAELKSMPSPKLKACGGVVDRVMEKMSKGGRLGEPTPWKGPHSSSTGVNAPLPTRETAGWHGNSQSEAGHRVRTGNKYGADMASSKKVAYEDAKTLHRRTLAEIRADKHDRRYMSEGGKVANTDELTAGFEPNEFDDLHLRDDLDFEYTGANSGDELGNEGEDERRRDIVSRIMRSRAKRAGHNPRPA